MGCLNILKESFNNMSANDISDFIDTAVRSGNHMLSLLDKILKISKDKHLAHQVVLENHIFQSLAFEAAEGMKNLAIDQQVNFSYEVLPGERIIISTDKTKVIQIVSNLTNNAIKFANGGSVSVLFQLVDRRNDALELWERDARKYEGVAFTMIENTMYTSIEEVKEKSSLLPEQDAAMKWIVIRVKDSGSGMHPDELARMFEPYTQSSSGADRAFQGTGLGLYICVFLCQQLRAFLACSSTRGVGTSFHVGFPVSCAEVLAPAGGLISEHSEQPTERNPIFIRGPLLIVDDNEINLKVLDRSLTIAIKKTGLDVNIIRASGGAEAIQVYKEMHPSLVFIDYHMPGIDGSVAIERIRAYEKEKGLPASYIISCTADVTEKAKERLLWCGADDIMEKPPPKGFMSDLVRRFVITSEEKPGKSE